MMVQSQIEIVVAILGPMGGFTVWLMTTVKEPWKQFLDMLEDWRGEEPRPGYQGRAGVMVRLERLEARGLAHTDEEIAAIAETMLNRQIASNAIVSHKLAEMRQEMSNTHENPT